MYDLCENVGESSNPACFGGENLAMMDATQWIVLLLHLNQTGYIVAPHLTTRRVGRNVIRVVSNEPADGGLMVVCDLTEFDSILES